MNKALADLLPVLKRAFPNLEAELSVIGSCLDRGAADPGFLAKAYLEGDSLNFRLQALNIGER